MALHLCTVSACAKGTLGLNLSRAPWDPYPWVSGVQAESSAELGGVRVGDTVLELNGCDVLGLRISELAARLHDHWQSGAEHVTLMMWRQIQQEPAATDSAATAEEQLHAAQHGINQQSLQKFATCLQHIAQLLECPVCLEVVKPPGWQCCNGHVLCNNCRSRSVKCPVCRVPLGPRGRCLLSDKLFTLLAEHFPCDGVQSNRMSEMEAPGSNNNCTSEFHQQPKMALAKSNFSRATQQQSSSSSPKKCNKSSRQSAAMETTNCVQILEGNEQQNGQTENNVATNPSPTPSPIPLPIQVGGADGVQRVTIKVQQQQDKRQQSCLMMKTSSGWQSGGGGTDSSGNNMLVKAKLKLSRKSWQITGQEDQDELHNDRATANVNNGIH